MSVTFLPSSTSSSSSLFQSNLLEIALSSPVNTRIQEFPFADVDIALHISWPSRELQAADLAKKEAAVATQKMSAAAALAMASKKRKVHNTTAKTPYLAPDAAVAEVGEVADAKQLRPDGMGIDKDAAYRQAKKLFEEEKALNIERLQARGQMQRQEIEPHPKLYDVIPIIFNEFWEMTFEPKMSVPFFACITPENCTELGIPNYFEKIVESCTLANIKVRLEKREYKSLPEFTADFRTMYANTLQYYPRNGDIFKEANELKARYERRRKSSASKFKW